jgi:hypothetical protein
MGVTIHFEGKLKSEESFDMIITKATEFAVVNDIPYSVFFEENKVLLRVDNEDDYDYIGSTKGIRLQPHPDSDPLNLEFDKELYIQEYCKTQFSDYTIHIKIIDFLRSIQQYFVNLTVMDEGEYWETENRDILQEHLNNIFEEIQKAKNEDADLSGPFRVADGRIIDLMRNG